MEATQLKILIDSLAPKQSLTLYYEIGGEQKTIKISYMFLHDAQFGISASYKIKNNWFSYILTQNDTRTETGRDLNEIRAYEIYTDNF